MKVLQTVKAAGAAMCVLTMLTIMGAAHADVRFHYDSAPIPWNFTAINDWEYSDRGSQYKPDFSIFFDAPSSWAHPAETTIFTIPTPSIRMWNESAKFTIKPNGDQLVMVDPTGSILAWRFGYSLTPIFGPNADPRAVAINNRYDIYSTNSMGSSCPCDNITIYRNDVAFQNGRPVPTDRILINYRDTNIGGTQWSIGAVSAVPEPDTYGMMLGGVGMIGWLVRRKRKSLAV
jgi:hypothetical protein